MKKNLFKTALLSAFVFVSTWAGAQTFTNEEVTATWGMASGEDEPSQAVVTNEDAFSTTSFVLGSELSFTEVKTFLGVSGDVQMNGYTPSAKMNNPAEGHDWTFTVKPAQGLTFQPSEVSFCSGVFGTSGGSLDIVVRYADGTEETLATGVKSNRSPNSDDPRTVDPSVHIYPVSGQATSDAFSLVVKLYGHNAGKEIALSNVTIKGTVSGTAIDVPRYALNVTMEPENAGEVEQMPGGALLDEGTEVTLTAVPDFGFHFVNWVNAAGEEVSAENPYTFALQADTDLKAVFEQVNVYSFSTRCINDMELQVGSVTLDPLPVGGKYEEGTVVTVTANELPIARFLNWADEFENANVTTAERTVTVNEDMEIVANYEIQDFIAAFNSDKGEIWAGRGDGYPFVADYAWDAERNATASVVKASDGTLLEGNASGTPVVRLRKSCVISSVSGLYMNGYNSKDVAMQFQFSTQGFTTVRFTGDLVAKNAACVHWTVFYSVDGKEFKQLTTAEGTPVDYALTASVAMPVDFELPAEEVAGKDMVYIRFTGTGDEIFKDYAFDKVDDASGLNYCSNSETGLGNVYIFGTPVIEEDHDAPTVKAITPADGATGISSNGRITVTFSERIQEGQGEATLAGNGKSITLEPEYGSSSVTFRYNNLAYSTDYTFALPEGYVTDRSGNPAPAVQATFTVMERTKPEKRIFNAIVDQSLETTIEPTQATIGQYKTIQEAIDAVPTDNNKPWLIFIKAGYYNDLNNRTFPTGKYTWDDQSGDLPATEDSRIVLVDRPFVYLIGEDVEKVTIAQDRIAGSNSADHNQPWYNVAEGATLVVTANDFYAENLTIDNEWWTKYEGTGTRGPQALALYVEADRAAFNNCRIRSYQDTYLSPKTQNTNQGNKQPHYFDRNYFRNTFIEGAVDFIYGGGDVYFDNCTLNIVRDAGGYIVAPSHYEATRWGYVFRNTVITAPDEDNTQVYFGRPWHNAPKTVFIDTECRVKTYEGYWYPEMGAIPALWAVYNIWDKNGYLMTNESREDYWYEGDNGEIINGKAKNYLTDEEAAEYTVENVLSGDGSDLATGIWNPLPMVEQTSKPVLRGGTDGQVVWDADEYAICYVVKVNGTVKAFVTEPSYAANEGETIVVQSVNEYGALSEPSDEFVSQGTSVDEGIREDADAVITVIGSKGIVSVRGISEPVHIAVYTMNGMLVQEMDVDRNISFSLPAGLYIVKANGTVAKVSVSR